MPQGFLDRLGAAGSTVRSTASLLSSPLTVRFGCGPTLSTHHNTYEVSSMLTLPRQYNHTDVEGCNLILPTSCYVENYPYSLADDNLLSIYTMSGAIPGSIIGRMRSTWFPGCLTEAVPLDWWQEWHSLPTPPLPTAKLFTTTDLDDIRGGSDNSLDRIADKLDGLLVYPSSADQATTRFPARLLMHFLRTLPKSEFEAKSDLLLKLWNSFLPTEIPAIPFRFMSCDAAALLCLAPLPPANKRASARRRC